MLQQPPRTLALLEADCYLLRECSAAERTSWVGEQVRQCQKSEAVDFALGALQLLLVTHKALLPADGGVLASVCCSVIPFMLGVLDRQALTG